MKVRVTDDAKSDLGRIKAYIQDRNAIVAEQVIDRIRAVIMRLTLLPRLGHAGVVHGTHEISVPRVTFVLVYRLDVADTDEELVILRVYHTAQDR